MTNVCIPTGNCFNRTTQLILHIITINHQCVVATAISPPSRGTILTRRVARNPQRQDIPTTFPPWWNASGSIVWAIIVNMAPASNEGEEESTATASNFHVTVYRQLDPERIQSLAFGAATCVYAGYLAGERLFHYALGYAAGATFAVGAVVHRVIRKTEQAALPSWLRYSGNVALVASPHLAFALAGPMWRTIARPAVSYVVGTYTCTSVACLSLDVSNNSTALMSWAIKIFVTVCGLFGVFTVSRWGIFATSYVDVGDEFGRTEHGVLVTSREPQRPLTQIMLRQVINALGLAMVFNASSNRVVSVVLIALIVFRGNLYHTWWSWYMWCSAGKSHRATRRISQEEYEEQGVAQTARALRALRRELRSREGRQAMAQVKADNYSRLERFRDGGAHYDLPEAVEGEEGGGWWCVVS